MKIIRELSECIEDEIRDAKHYAEQALAHKEEYPEVSAVYAKLSEERISAMSRLHEVVASLIRTYRDKNGEPPAGMLAVYNYLHERHIADTAQVKALQEMYKR